ncbi:N-6 DNA methylase [Bradyrhizobium sp. 186]|uniref:Eco57I restriction-modification methylase domain-containing protein n=1 Tax=Bradyrhizobium sp. 186 TaxID=2782654 RepID=UPI00200131DB|nr:TaqI-like C-terminal specificity domain-containing protein [Bradyrhizobium sp. 186]UPK35481.1 N-6 DNA methylase [Bradyrhizobium sp. 186]
MDTARQLTELIGRFERNRDSYLSSHYNETQVRREFVDPLFRLLGWDVDNTSGHAEAYKDVIHEDAIKIGGNTKAPDYCFRIGGVRKFFVEAKKPAVKVKTDQEAAFQLRRYGWSAKLPLSVLTDFEEFAVYDTRLRPNKDDDASVARVLYLNTQDYLNRWSEIDEVFSKEAILRGSFDRYATTAKAKRGTLEVDSAFLSEIEEWRLLLAKNFALRNPSINETDLNYAVQMTIDRIVFLRICEDRGIEDYGRLRDLRERPDTYGGLLDLYRKAEARYNSGLFHFAVERNRWGVPDTLTPRLQFDDKILRQILGGLYYPESPYEFSVLPADILGQVYEEFLGKAIRLTKSHRAVVEEKPEVRKAGGVYYTPAYIVSYMVRQTVHRLLNGPDDRPAPITLKKASSLRILDPACGSGTFLIEAYQLMLDWYLTQYRKNPEYYSRGAQPKLFKTRNGEWRLTTTERKSILLNNIYGADVDRQAVEVTKLSLLLKVTEGETEQIAQRDWIRDQERILPDLAHNIRCGNSIVGSDFYEVEQASFLPEETKYRINAFDWKTGFSQIMVHEGGFDCVIGNPPYVDIKGMPDEVANYIFDRYDCANNRINLFATFIEKSVELLKSSDAYFSMIVPTALLVQSSYSDLRGALLRRTNVLGLTRLPNESFGSSAGKVKVDTVILTASMPSSAMSPVRMVAYKGYERIKEIVPDQAAVNGTLDKSRLAGSKMWAINTTDEDDSLLKKVRQRGVPLETFVQISLGLTPYDKYRGHTKEQIKSQAFHATVAKDETFKPLLSGNDVRRYSVKWNGIQYISYGPWLGAPREQRFFTQRRILVKQIIDWTDLRIWAAVCEDEFYNTQNAFALLPKDGANLDYLAGVLNSKLMSFYHRKTFLDEFKMRFQKILIKECKQFPFVGPATQEQESLANEIAKKVRALRTTMASAQAATTPSQAEFFSNKAGGLDNDIDQLVYTMYELSPAEVQRIEAAFAKIVTDGRSV